MNWNSLELDVIRWAEARKIIPNSTPVAQARKTAEEAGELLEAAANLALLDKLADQIPELKAHFIFIELYDKTLTAYKDAVGDVAVTLINGCALADVTVTECLAGSYDEIKNRTGTLLPNGVFQKDS